LTVEEVGSGAKTRPRREELLRAARRKEIDIIVVWRLDRWGRSLVDLIATLQELTALKVGFVSLSEALDLTTPSGRAFAGMLAVFAEFERDIRSGESRYRSSPQRVPTSRPPRAHLRPPPPRRRLRPRSIP
jgi:putative DNA-invertase from lambdoid prophage Rac